MKSSGLLHWEKMTEGKREWPNPFGDGHAASWSAFSWVVHREAFSHTTLQ